MKKADFKVESVYDEYFSFLILPTYIYILVCPKYIVKMVCGMERKCVLVCHWKVKENQVWDAGVFPVTRGNASGECGILFLVYDILCSFGRDNGLCAVWAWRVMGSFRQGGCVRW